MRRISLPSFVWGHSTGPHFGYGEKTVTKATDISTTPTAKRHNPSAAVTTVLPGSALGQASQDHELIALCNEAIALECRLRAGYPERPALEEEEAYNAAMQPAYDCMDELRRRISEVRAVSLDGMRARAAFIVTRYEHMLTPSNLHEALGASPAA